MDKESFRDALRAHCKAYHGYRLADTYLRPHWRSANGEEPLCAKTARKFPATIAGRYSVASGFAHRPRPAVLLAVIESMYDLTPVGGSVAHLRAGDVLLLACDEHRARHTPPADKALQIALTAKSKEVTVVTGSHYLSGIEATVNYTSEVVRLLRQHGVTPTVQTGAPDDDFVKLLRTKTLVPSRGGWTQLLEILRPHVHA